MNVRSYISRLVIIAIFVTGIVAVTLRINDQIRAKKDKYYRICKSENKYKCEGKCWDGWGKTMYYNRKAIDLRPYSMSGRIPDSLTKYILLTRFISVCEPCRNDYIIGNSKKITTCKEYHRILDSLNNTKSTTLDSIEFLSG